MSDTTRLYDLLAEWDEHRQQGKTLTVEQLCPDDPDMQAELRQRIDRQLRLRRVLEPPAAAAPAAALLPAVDGYDIQAVIGSGGMGVVYRAGHTALGRTVALKMILAGRVDRVHLARFREEARAVAALQHPHIVQVFDAGEAGGQPYLALEYVPGGSLAAHLAGTPIDPRRAAAIARQIAGAVQHAHDHGIVHRDLKPANVLLAADGTPKVTDFGLAKRLGEEAGMTRTGVALGSPSYMPPEQAAGDAASVGPAADVYAVGAVLYEMLTGRPPFLGATVLDTIRQVTDCPPAEPRALQPTVPPDLQTVCLKCLEKRPADRYASAAELAADLGRFLAGEAIVARPPSAIGIVVRNLRRANFDPRFARIGTVLLCVAPVPALVHVAAFFALRDHPRYPVWMTLISTAVLILTNGVTLVTERLTAAGVPAAQRRHFVNVWGAELLGTPLLWLTVWLAVPADRPELLFLVYPVWTHVVGRSFLAFAADAGLLYVHGAVFLLLSLALVFVLPWTPLVLAGVMFVNMTASGLLVRSGVGTRPRGGPRRLGPPYKTVPHGAGTTSDIFPVSRVRTPAPAGRASRRRRQRGDP